MQNDQQILPLKVPVFLCWHYYTLTVYSALLFSPLSHPKNLPVIITSILVLHFKLVIAWIGVTWNHLGFDGHFRTEKSRTHKNKNITKKNLVTRYRFQSRSNSDFLLLVCLIYFFQTWVGRRNSYIWVQTPHQHPKPHKQAIRQTTEVPGAHIKKANNKQMKVWWVKKRVK